MAGGQLPLTPVALDGSPVHSTAETAGGHRRSVIDRRRFVLGVGAVLATSAGTAALARRVRSSDSVNAMRRSTVLPRPRRSTLPPASQPFTADGLTPYVTPNADFYRIDTALLTPQVTAQTWSLSVAGLVDRPFSITYDELLDMESVEETVTIACVSNEVGGHLIGNAVWQGVPLATLLERAGVRDGATQIVGRSVDGFTAGFPTAVALDGRTALVAYAMNGEPLPADHGYPARLIVAGLYGYVSATKWLSEVELTTWEDFNGYWVPRGWSKEGPIKTASRIDVPSRGASLVAGRQAIAGVAWAPDVGIERVEVQVDDGAWQDAELGRTASDDTWVQWHLAWDAEPGDHTIRVRATDKSGVTQTSDTAPPAPDGATGWPSRTVTVA
jgi:DMSO/TMAO reductase YedYZ molybdopterin-dependent catalytic subunit